MPHDLALRVVLELGSRRVETDAQELEALLAVPGLAGRLLALVLGERGGGGSERLPLPPETLERFSEKRCVGGQGRGLGKPSGGTAVDNFAGYLADALDDRKSLAWYRKVVAELPHEVVRDAFVRARDTRREDIRRSRAALFTSIVRPLLTHPTRLCPPDTTPDANRASSRSSPADALSPGPLST